MGMINMFTDTADFSGISNSFSTVSDVVQKIVIDINEIGTEFGATTGNCSRLFIKFFTIRHFYDLKIISLNIYI